MIGEEIAPGLRRWTTFHEEWGEEVGSLALERNGHQVLIDPLLPAGQGDRLQAPEDGDLHVILTVHYHARSTAEILRENPAARVWAHWPDSAWIRRRTPVTDLFRPGDPLPGGLEAIVVRPRTEVILWDPSSRALIPGDALVGAEDRGISMCPAWWLPQSATIEQLREKLLPLLDLPVEMVLVSHGEPVLSGGQEALAEALKQPERATARSRGRDR
jgi:glyoxylase-like metal-dependent hydrolase (beta-lactamase superfamily II)